MARTSNASREGTGATGEGHKPRRGEAVDFFKGCGVDRHAVRSG